MSLAVKDDGWRLSDALWAQLNPLLPVYRPPAHPLGCHRRRIEDRVVMEGILFVLRTGCQWNALNATEITPTGVSSAASWQTNSSNPPCWLP